MEAILCARDLMKRNFDVCAGLLWEAGFFGLPYENTSSAFLGTFVA